MMSRIAKSPEVVLKTGRSSISRVVNSLDMTAKTINGQNPTVFEKSG